MPQVPYTTPQAQVAAAGPDPTFIAIAGREYIDATKEMQSEGMVTEGNIDLNNRPMVKNPDGSTSTVRSITVTEDDGKAILLPTVVGDKVVSNQEAIKHYQKTGEHLGIFDNEDKANAYAEKLHKAQAKQYGLE